MATQAPRLWRDLLAALEKAATADATAGDDVARQLTALALKAQLQLGSEPSLPRAVWKKLLFEMKVPSKLVAAAGRLRTPAAAYAFAVGLNLLVATGVNTHKGLADSWGRKQGGNMLQQLQQAELLQVLPALLTASAQQLWDLQQLPPQELATVLADPAYHTPCGWSTSPYTRSHLLQHTHVHVAYLLSIVSNLLSLARLLQHPSHHMFAAALAGPTLQLSLLVMQHASTCLELLPAHMQPVPQQQQLEQGAQQQPHEQQQQQPPQLLWHILRDAQSSAAEVMRWAVIDDCICCEAAHAQLLRAPYCLPAVCSCVLLMCYSSLMGAEHRAWQRAGGRGDWQQLAWQLAWRGQHKLLVAQEELLRLTGCSSKALLWAAALSARGHTGFSTNHMSLAVGLIAHIAQSTNEAVREAVACAQGKPQLQPGPQQQQQQQQGQGEEGACSSPGHTAQHPGQRAMLSLVPVAVLHWASHALPACDDHEAAECTLLLAAHVCDAGSSVLAIQSVALAGMPRSSRLPGPPAAAAGAAEAAAGAAAGVVAALAAVGEGSLRQQTQWESLAPDWRALTPAVYLQVLHEALDAAVRLLQETNKGPAQADSSADVAEWGRCYHEMLGTCLHYLLTLSTELVGVLTGEPLPPAVQWGLVEPSDLALPAYFRVWAQQSAQLCASLEAAVRQQAAAAGVTASACVIEVCHAVVMWASPACCCDCGVLLAAAAAAGPGSEQQLQLYALLRSLLKWAQGAGESLQRLAEEVRTVAAVAASNLLVQAASTKGREVGRQQHSIVQALPWLGILACCCLQWARRMQQLPPADPKPAAMAAANADLTAVGGKVPRGILLVLFGETDSQTVWNVFFGATECLLLTVFAECMRGVNELLRAGQDAACPGLGTAGYGPALQALQQQLEGTHAAIQAAAPAEPGAPWALGPVVQQLSSLGLGLSSVAHKWSCNNPACCNLAGPSELQLVRGRSNTCSGCRVARYCSSGCMKQHWKQHRPVCKALAAAAAGVAATGGDPAACAEPAGC